MRTTQFQQVIILSAELSDLGKMDNGVLTKNLKRCLIDLGLSFNVAYGRYNGESETSFVVLVNTEADIEVVKGLAFQSFNQESVLYQDRKGDSYLYFSDTIKTPIGKLRLISETAAWKSQNFTYMNEQYYSTTL